MHARVHCNSGDAGLNAIPVKSKRLGRAAASYVEVRLEVFRVNHVAATNATTMTSQVIGSLLRTFSCALAPRTLNRDGLFQHIQA